MAVNFESNMYVSPILKLHFIFKIVELSLSFLGVAKKIFVQNIKIKKKM